MKYIKLQKIKAILNETPEQESSTLITLLLEQIVIRDANITQEWNDISGEIIVLNTLESANKQPEKNFEKQQKQLNNTTSQQNDFYSIIKLYNCALKDSIQIIQQFSNTILQLQFGIPFRECPLINHHYRLYQIGLKRLHKSKEIIRYCKHGLQILVYALKQRKRKVLNDKFHRYGSINIQH